MKTHNLYFKFKFSHHFQKVPKVSKSFQKLLLGINFNNDNYFDVKILSLEIISLLICWKGKASTLKACQKQWLQFLFWKN